MSVCGRFKCVFRKASTSQEYHTAHRSFSPIACRVAVLVIRGGKGTHIYFHEGAAGHACKLTATKWFPSRDCEERCEERIGEPPSKASVHHFKSFPGFPLSSFPPFPFLGLGLSRTSVRLLFTEPKKRKDCEWVVIIVGVLEIVSKCCVDARISFKQHKVIIIYTILFVSVETKTYS